MKRTALWLLAAALLTGMGACGGGETENCTNGVDDDGDGFVDCEDGSCASDSSCKTTACGDGVRSAQEDCDGTDVGGKTCAALGLGDGALLCKADCSFDTTNCTNQACGDGHVDPGEKCDGADLGGQTCDKLGFAGGALSCKADCSFDTAGCGSPEQCNDGLDNDKDLLFDCSDPDCQTDPICSTGGETICDDLVDDDGDGLVDCQDPDDCQQLAICANGATPIGGPCLAPKDCMAQGNDPVCLHDHDYPFPGGYCSEFCTIGGNDCGTKAHCVGPLPGMFWGLCVATCTTDADCRAGYECDVVANDQGTAIKGCMPTQEICTGGIDDDGDGKIDCQDSGCDMAPACVEDCKNGLDDDGDGKIDCQDKACDNSPDCVESCNNDLDDDGDGYIDCKDSQCKYSINCTEDCGNKVDDNGNGKVDCDDDACAMDYHCVEDCWNGIDDDGDGFADCADSDCKMYCPDPEICSGGIDEDFDGFTDCEDPDCQASEPSCNPTAMCSNPPVLQNGVALQGTTVGGTNLARGFCALESGALERVYRFDAGMPGDSGEMQIEFDDKGNGLVVYFREACADPFSEFFCGQGSSSAGGPIGGGTYYFFVDGLNAASKGAFSLKVTFTLPVCGDGTVTFPEECDPPNGTTCDANCRIILGPEAICDDLNDNDMDGYHDCIDSDCKGTPACMPGAAPVGSVCMNHSDCAATGGDPICLYNWPSGYCSEGCNINAPDCPSGALCMQAGPDEGLCVGTCNTNADCRSGYACLDMGNGNICYPN